MSSNKTKGHLLLSWGGGVGGAGLGFVGEAVKLVDVTGLVLWEAGLPRPSRSLIPPRSNNSEMRNFIHRILHKIYYKSEKA